MHETMNTSTKKSPPIETGAPFPRIRNKRSETKRESFLSLDEKGSLMMNTLPSFVSKFWQ